MAAVRVAIIALLASCALAEAGDTNPVQKIVQLLSDLEAKIIKEGEASQKTFDEFSEWCEDRAANLGFEIKTAESEVEDLNADIEKAGSLIQELSSKIEDTSADIATNEADLKAATAVRTKEASDFSAQESELVDVISSLDRAIAVLERELQKGGASMLQLHQAGGVVQAIKAMVEASMLASQDASKLTALVQSASQEDDSSDDSGAPDASAYESKSGSIVDTLEGLNDKAKDQLDKARKTETNSKNNFEMLKQSLSDEIKFGNKDLGDAKKNLAATKEHKAIAEGDLSVTSKDLAEDKETKGSLKHNCMTKAEDFQSATKSRGEELKALSVAKKAIKDMTSGAAEVTYSLDQTSFLQFSQDSRLKTGADLANFEAVRFVRNLAEKQHSDVLAQLARRMAAAIRYGTAAGEDPFAKVKGLLRDMVETLEKDAQADATQKAYCDKELGETAEKKADKEAEIDKLTAKIDSMSAKSAQLKEQVAALQKALADLASTQAEMNKIRTAEKTEFNANKPEMEAGLEGCKIALKVLRDYYANDDKAHAAAEGGGSGIIGLIEVVESDFSKNLAEMSASESASQMDYDSETKENDIERATKESDVKYKTKESKQLDSATAEAISDREGVQAELNAIMEYKGKLIEMCVAKPETYGERKSRREAEVSGLKEALSILEGEAVLLQHQSSTRRHHGLRGSIL